MALHIGQFVAACEAQFVDNQCAYYALPGIMNALDATVSRTLVLAEREL